MRIERRQNQTALSVIAAPLIAITVALSAAAILIAAAGVSVPEAIWKIATGALSSRLAVTETLARATPLILTGLSVAVAFRARVWNIGAEGQLYLGAIGVVSVSGPLLHDLPPFLQVTILLVVGSLAGMCLLLVPLWLRMRFAVDEVVTTLLLNFIAILFVSMLIDTILKDPSAFGWPQSIPIDDAASLPALVSRSRVTIGLMIAIVLAVAIHLLQSMSSFGLQSRAMGLNPEAALFAGIPMTRTLILVAMLSGGLSGLAGAVEVMGVTRYVTTDLSTGYGYSGIVVAMLANLNPIGVIFSAMYIAIMFVGADAMGRSMGIPTYIADVIVALSLLSMLIAVFFTQHRIRR